MSNKRMALCIDDNAAADALIKASPRVRGDCRAAIGIMLGGEGVV